MIYVKMFNMIEQAEKISATMVEKIFSFDIFDTLITRTFAKPDGIFLVMQENFKNSDKFHFLPQSLKNNFYTVRKEAQLFCTSNQYILNKKHDCSLDDIYEVIKNNFSLNDDEKEVLKNYEIETELSNILPIEENINKVKKLVESGKKVILISDMYLSSEVVRKFLLKFDNVFKNTEIFTSGETGKLKSDGTLYKFIKEKYPKAKLTHCGDNRISDDFTARLNGIKTERYYPEGFKPYEKMYLGDKIPAYQNLSVGISRFARGFNKKSKAFDLGCSFAGPMLYGYVEWVLEQSLKRGIKHLYFVARDGYVLKEIADIILEQRNLDISTHYFYSSRIANRIPDKNNIDNFIKNFHDELPSLMTVDFVAERLHITIEEFKKFIDIKNPKKHLSPSETSRIVSMMLSDNGFKNFVTDKNKPRKDLFLRYIRQEIDLSKNDFAFVELNGTGRTQDNIVDLMALDFEVVSFFLINTSDMKQNEKSKKIFFSYSGDYLAEYLELFCRTEHGQTIGYEEKGEKIVPVLETEKYEQMEKWGYREYLDGLKLYTKLFCRYCCINNLAAFELGLFVKLFDYYKFNMDKETENLIRLIPFSIYGNETKTKGYLPKYNLINTLTDFNMLKNFLATNYFGFLKRVLFLILILSNIFRIKIDLKHLYQMYYKYFLR